MKRASEQAFLFLDISLLKTEIKYSFKGIRNAEDGDRGDKIYKVSYQ